MKLSVLMPVYNAERYLRASVESVLAQEGVELELVCVDDASTDGSLAMLRELAEADGRVKVVARAENGGEGPARNSGLDVVTGDWLLLLDADDLLEPNCLAGFAARLATTDADVAIYRFTMFDDASGFAWDCPEAYQTGWFTGESGDAFDPHQYPDHLFGAFWSSVCNKCFRMSFVRARNIRFDDTPRIGDVYFTLTGLALAHKVQLVDQHLYRYRVNVSTSLTGTGDAHPLTFWRACSVLHGRLVDEGEWETYRLGYLNWLSENLPYNLLTMKSSQGYLELLDAFREYGFEELGFGSFAREEAANVGAYDHCMALWRGDVTSGLFDFMKRKAAEAETVVSEVRHLRATCERQAGELEAARRELADVRASVSFRAGRALTAPLRAVRDVLHGKTR